MTMKSLSVRGIRIDRMAGMPVVTLREVDSPRREMQIFIGAPEASAIKTSLEGESTPRPMTHDLFVLALERLGVEIVRVVITHVVSGTFFADLVLSSPSGEETTVSCRPSDGIALALRAHCALYALEDLLDTEGKEVPDEDVENDAEEILDEFKSFIENISPEDFEG